MTALIIIGSVLLFLAFLLSLGIKIIISYDGNVSLWVKVLFVKIKSINPHPPWIAWGGSRSPYQRYVVIEINDCDVKNIDFEVKELAYSFDSFF
jgi:hypothetical protein